MSNEPTTDRAQRQQAVSSGERADAVDRVSRATTPGGNGRETTSRNRQQRAARDVADQIDIERDGVGTVQRLSGLDVFLRSSGESQFRSTLREDFAGEADFVQSEDVATEVDPEDITGSARVAQDRRDDVATRARRQTAADAEFIGRGDLAADVGPRGVADLRVREGRRDDVADRVRSDLASDNPFTRPSDFEATVTATGVEQAGFAEGGRRRAAARQFESETLLGDVDPSGDVTERENGFGLDQQAQQRAAAERFESSTPFDDLGPSDVTLSGGQAQLVESRQRELGARQLDDQLPNQTVTASDVQLEETGDGLRAVFEEEVRA